ncbi:MAG: chitin-binding domain-containing protein [Rhodobacter sp.]|nr:chitin-binding domain-containing protein [Rhodobacter sp.]
MKIKTAIFATILAVAPTLTFAACNWQHSTQEAMSCAEGMVWDAETETCVEQVTS